MVKSRAVFEPDIPDSSIDKEARKVEDRLEDIEAEVGIDASGRPGRRGGGGGGAGAGLAGGMAARGGLGSAGGAASLASKALPVALAGGVAFGILKGIRTLASASPALKQTSTMMSSAVKLFFRPFGDFLAQKLRPMASSMLDMAIAFNKIAGDEGLDVAVVSMPKTFESSTGRPAESLITGTIQIGSLLGSPVNLSEVVTKAAVSEFLTPTEAASLLTGTVQVASLLTGRVNIGRFLFGSIDITDFLGSGRSEPNELFDPGGEFGPGDRVPPASPGGGGQGGGIEPGMILPSRLEGDQLGGVVTRGGATVVHEGEAILPERQIERFAQGGMGQEVANKLDQLIRVVENLANRPLEVQANFNAHEASREMDRARERFEKSWTVSR